MTTDNGGSGQDWTPQETVALIAPLFGMGMEDIQDVVILATSREGGGLNQIHTIEGNDQRDTRERVCRLLYIQSLLTEAHVQVGSFIHEEIHSP
jgi:hypothetical protein